MPGRLDKVAVPEFAASWGAAEPTPLFAYRLAEGPTQWSVATRPRSPEITVDKTLALSFDGCDATLQLDAVLGDTSGYVFQYRLLAPPELKIESIAVSAADFQLAARWTQDRKGAITVFLTGPVAGEHHLMLRGRLPALQGKKLPLPLVEIDGGRVQSSSVQIFRQPGILVQLEQVVGWIELKERPAEPERPEFGRLVYWLRAAGGVSPRAVVSILPKVAKSQPAVREARQTGQARRTGHQNQRPKAGPAPERRAGFGRGEGPPGRHPHRLATRRWVPRRGHLRRRARQGFGMSLVAAGRIPPRPDGGGRPADAAGAIEPA